MLPVLTPDEMRAADERTIAAGTPGSVLMDRAGRAVAWAARRLAGSPYGLRAVVLCGKGNNGGDGMVAADLLEHWGARVTRVPVIDGLDRRRVARELARAPVVIDAMFGTGLKGSLDGDVAWAADAVADSDAPVVAVDIPSGVDGATGAVAGTAVTADLTVVMAALKVGLVQEPGRTRAGAVEIAQVGIDPGPVSLGLLEASDVAEWLPRREPDANKWSVGAVLTVGGSGGMTGAPMLVARAAMRTGAGIVWCALPGDAAERASGTEVITKPLPARGDALAADASDTIAEYAGRFHSVVVGPGLGTAPETASAVTSIIEVVPNALLLDADGLNALDGDLEPLRARAPRPTVLTPHGGEYARLAGREVGADRVGAARELAQRSKAIVLLKGPGTVIADPNGRAVVNPTGTPALASAGTGDVLAGIVGGLISRGMAPFEAAAAGSYLHGAASEHVFDAGLVAPDLIEALPEVLDDIEAPGLVPTTAVRWHGS
jgi:ADP-dependent NAD(P)H-hydrate dehydratase / NAD(P)H-hydrate epimerase